MFSLTEQPRNRRNAEFDDIGQNRRVRDLLLEKGYDLVYAEYPEGHSWGNWKAHIDDILLTFWPK